MKINILCVASVKIYYCAETVAAQKGIELLEAVASQFGEYETSEGEEEEEGIQGMDIGNESIP